MENSVDHLVTTLRFHLMEIRLLLVPVVDVF